MPAATSTGSGTREDPWTLTTPPGKSQYEAYRDTEADPPALVVQVGSTELRYHVRAITDLHDMLRQHGDWMALGNAELRGRFGNYVPPVLERLGLAEVEHNPRNNRMRAI